MKKKRFDISNELLGNIFLLISILCCLYIILSDVNSDIFFILANGRYILENDNLFPTTLFYSMHDNLPTVIQQPLFSVISYLLYSLFGFGSIRMFSCICMLVSCVLLLMIFRDTKARYTRLMITAVYLLMFSTIFCGRPVQLSLIAFLLEIYLLDKGIFDASPIMILKAVILFALSMLVLLSHAAFYPFFIALLLFFVIRNRVVYSQNTVVYLGTVVLSFIFSFITPYGYRLPFYVFLSYPAANNGGFIKELSRPPVLSSYGIFLIIMLVILIKNLDKVPLLDALLVFVGSILLALHVRNFWLFGVFTIPFICQLVSDKDLHPVQTKKGFPVPICVFIALCVAIVTFLGDVEVKDSSVTPVMAAEYLQDKDGNVFTEFNNGAYFEFCGLNSFIDARPELYSKAISQKADIYSEYLSLLSDHDFDYNDFIEKYDFKYMVATKDTPLYLYLKISGFERVVDGNGYALFEVY